MADYRDLAAALGGGYGQDTGGITPDTLVTLRNGKKASASDLLGMLKGIGSASLSNLESLVRGGVAQVPGAAGDIEGLARMGINKSFGAGGVNVNPTPVLPTTTDILGMMPRATATRPETAGMEEMGTMIAPGLAKAAAPAVKGGGNLLDKTQRNVEKMGLPSLQIEDKVLPVTMHKLEEKTGNQIVNISPETFDKAFAKTDWQYVGRGGEGGIEGRYKRFENWLKDAKSMTASNVSVNKDGGIVFGDGRHRYAVLRDMGLDKLPISMDKESIKNAKKFGYLSE